jgi:hypothetical protein
MRRESARAIWILYPDFKLRNQRVEQGNKKMTRHNLQMDSYFGVSSELVTVKDQSEHFKEKQKIIALV